MANLFTDKVVATDYTNLAEATGLTFTNDTKYNGQVNGGMVILREGTTGRGFIVEATRCFDFTYTGTPIYIKTNAEGAVINLAD